MLRALPKRILQRVSQHFSSPSEVLNMIDIREGQRVLELGSPVGFFAPASLQKVGPSGQVYVAGPNHESLEKLTHLGKRDNLHLVLLADVLTGQSVPPSQIDTIILTNLLARSVHPDSFCLSLGQYMHPASEIVLLDWEVPTTQRSSDPASKKVTREDAIKLLRDCGFDFVRVLQISGYQYGLVFSFSDTSGYNKNINEVV